MLENDVLRVAHAMIDLYDLDAAWYAKMRSDDLAEQGEAGRSFLWAQIALAIEQQQPLAI
jgi:hypothetical protein